MNTYADKKQAQQGQSFANPVSEKNRDCEPHHRFIDHRRATTAQLKLQEMANNSTRAVQLKTFQKAADDHVAQRQHVQKTKNETGLPDRLKSGIENLSGLSMDDVKVHYDSAKPAQLQAHGFAQGTDIHISPGQEKYLPHEAWHVVQQKQGRVKPTMQMHGKVAVNDDAGLENEADEMGAKALTYSGQQPATQLRKVGLNAAVKQLKVGVEYETKWTIEGEKAEAHKQKIFESSGWHLESDANYLEFVVDPPVNKPEDLAEKAALMARIAEKIRANDNQTAEQILGPETTDFFKKKKISRGDADQAMSAKGQFTFGISMSKLQNFLSVIGEGKMPEGKYNEANKEFGFLRQRDMTNRQFIGSKVKSEVDKSRAYRQQLASIDNAGSDELKGFLAYLGYYVKSMETEYTEPERDFETFSVKSKAAHLAQSILKASNAGGEEGAFTLKAIAAQLRYKEINIIIDKLSVLSNVELKPDSRVDSLSGETIEEIKKFRDDRLDNPRFIDYPKYRFMLMNRSGFDKMYQKLRVDDQSWFRGNIGKIVEKLGREEGSFLFNSPYTYKTKDGEGKVTEKGFSAGPTIKAWLESIAESSRQQRDSLSPPKEFIDENGRPDPDQSMGSLGLIDESDVPVRTLEWEEADVGEKGAATGPKSKKYSTSSKEEKLKQVVIELREWGDYIKPEHWADQSYDMAFLHNQISPGELDSEYKTRLAELFNQIEELKKRKVIKLSGNKDQVRHQQNFNRGINARIADVQHDIHMLNQKYNKRS
jgi:hypothetical protein